MFFGRECRACCLFLNVAHCVSNLPTKADSMSRRLAFGFTSIVLGIVEVGKLNRPSGFRPSGPRPTVPRSNLQSKSSRVLGSGSKRNAPQQKTWDFEAVDAEGKTELDRSYEESYKRTMMAFQDSPSLMTTSSEADRPDFLIGLGQYKFRLRNQYRHAIADVIDEVNAFDQVELSVGWRGRYDLERMPQGVHKILGVTLLEPKENQSSTSSNTSTDRKRLALSTARKQELVDLLVSKINSRRLEPLLNVNIIAAVPPSEPVAVKALRPKVKAALEAIHKIIAKHKVVVFHRNPKFAQAHHESTVALPEGGEPLESTIGSNDLRTAKAVADRSWRRLFHSVQVIPHEVDVDAMFAGTLHDGTSVEPIHFEGEDRLSLEVKNFLDGLDVIACGSAALPAVFINGSYAGSARQLEFFNRQRKTLDALIRRPHMTKLQKNRLGTNWSDPVEAPPTIN